MFFKKHKWITGLLILVLLAVALLLFNARYGRMGLFDRFMVAGDIWDHPVSFFKPERNRDAVDATVDDFLAALQKRDPDATKAQFAPNALEAMENPDAMADGLLAYVQGEFQSSEFILSAYSDSTGGLGDKVIEQYTPYRFTTSAARYNLAVKYVKQDDLNPKNVGLWQVFVIDSSKLPPGGDAYFGELRQGRLVGVPGIFCNVPEPQVEEAEPSTEEDEQSSE